MEVQEYFQGARLKEYLQAYTPFESRRELRKLVDRGLVKVNGLVRPLSFELRAGDRIKVGNPEKEKSRQTPSPEICESGEKIVVLNKPSGQNLGTPVNGFVPELSKWPELKKKWPFTLDSEQGKTGSKVYPLYPVPEEASGVTILVNDESTVRKLRKKMGTETCSLHGTAIVDGQLHDEREISEPVTRSSVETNKKEVDPSGRSSCTRFIPEEQHRNFSFVGIRPQSVVNHQERVHLNWIHHPLSVDRKYGYREELLLSEFKKNYREKPLQEEKPLISRLSLHWESFSLSADGFEEISVDVSQPEDMEIAMKQIRKYA